MHFLITQRHTQNSQGEWIDSLENSYTRFFEALGVSIIPVSNATNVGRQTEAFDLAGIILTGGGDVDPELYGNDANPALAVSKQRDAVETRLLNLAIDRKLPVLGICRGMQFINVFFGGKLLQNIGDLEGSDQHPCPGVHEVRILDSPLAACLPSDRTFSTNSYHLQAVIPAGLGDGLGTFAQACVPELIEGIYHRDLPIAGMQWHPERPASATTLDRLLLTAFIERRLFWEVRH
jgi:gamma-glutamyl-gamma-aminobutyrate hydrolase PuuD